MLIHLRRRRLPLIALFATAVLVAPVLTLMLITSNMIGDALLARAETERTQTAAVAGRLLGASLAAAGKDLESRHSIAASAFAENDTKALAQVLVSMRMASPLYETAAAFDTTGNMLARDPDPGGVVSQSFSTRDYFVGAVASDRPYVSEVFRSAVAPFSPLVAVAFAIKDERRTYGVINVTFSPGDVLSAFDPAVVVVGRHIVATDRRDRVIASTDAARVPLSDAGLIFGPRQAFVSTADIGSTTWRLFVVDQPASVLALQDDLDRQLQAGAAATAVAALVLGLLLAMLYEKGLRQRDALTVAQAGLAAANTDLAQADRAKSAFLADMSHELRTPLNAILGFSDLLAEQLDSTLNERQKRFFSNIHVAGEHLLSLVNDVLDLSKVEAGRLEMRPEVIEVGPLIEPPIVAARAAAESAALTFRCDEAATGVVRLDAGRTRQILFNLLSNAVKFTKAPGTVSIEVRFDDEALVLSIADSGIGIPALAAPRIFDLFERVNRDRSNSPGTGLGLALTKRLVELQGGTISFDSEVGRGTTFTVVLPDVRYRVSRSEAILIIEDDPSDAELLETFVSEAGLTSHRVFSLAEAVEAIRHHRPLGVLLDLYLPDGHGSTILETLKSAEETVDVPVLVVTSTLDTTRFRLMGAECMTKPIDPDRLRAWLRRVSPAAAA